MAEGVVNWVPGICMPSPEAPASRRTTATARSRILSEVWSPSNPLLLLLRKARAVAQTPFVEGQGLHQVLLTDNRLLAPVVGHVVVVRLGDRLFRTGIDAVAP